MNELYFENEKNIFIMEWTKKLFMFQFSQIKKIE